jgi:hypothetical protein
MNTTRIAERRAARLRYAKRWHSGVLAELIGGWPTFASFAKVGTRKQAGGPDNRAWLGAGPVSPSIRKSRFLSGKMLVGKDWDNCLDAELRRYPENHATGVGVVAGCAAYLGSSVEVSMTITGQTCHRKRPIRPIGEAVKHGFFAGRI